MTLSFTRNLHLAVPDFLTEPWHAEFAQAMDSIDQIIYSALIAQNTLPWANSTSYAIGALVISPDTGGLYSAAVANVSSAAPITFTQELSIHPGFWTALTLVLATQAEAEAGVDNTKYMTPLRVSQAIDAQVAAPTAQFVTGDVKLTYKNVADFGWIIPNDGSIGNDTSGATSRANNDTQDLFVLLYNNISVATAPVTCTISIATPTVITRANHGFVANQRISFSTTGTLPVGISPGQSFYVASTGLTAGTFQISATLGGTTIGVAGPQSGVHSVRGFNELVLQDSSGVQIGRGPNAVTDFNTNNRLVLPAMLGRVLGMAGAGAGLVNRPLGTVVGSDTETQTPAKMASHSHTMSSQGSVGGASPLSQFDPNLNMTFSGTVNGVSGTSIDATGGGQPLNIVQPTTFLNIMIKL